MFISNLLVVLLIRVVNLVIGRLSTANGDFCDLRVWQSDGVLSGSHFEKNCKPDRVSSGSHFEKNYKPDGGVIRLLFVKQNDNRMTPYPVYIFFQNVNRMGLHLIVIFKMWTGWHSKSF